MAATPVSGSMLPGGRAPQTVPRPRGRPRGSRTRHSFGTPLSSRTGRSHHSAAQRAQRQQAAHDHYKPREERSYKEFHKDLDVDAILQVFDSNEVDGITPAEASGSVGGSGDGSNDTNNNDIVNNNNNNQNESGGMGLGITLQPGNVEDEEDGSEKMNVDGGATLEESHTPAVPTATTATATTGGGEDEATDKDMDTDGNNNDHSQNQASSSQHLSENGAASPASFYEMVDPSAPTPTRRGRPPKRRPPGSATPKARTRTPHLTSNISSSTPAISQTPKKPIPPPPQLGNNIHDHERLSLPVPSFRPVKPFEMGGTYIDRAMAGVGFQETDYWQRPSTMVRTPILPNIEAETDLKILPDKNSNTVTVEQKGNSHVPILGLVEYDMDEQDDKWLAAHNKVRAERNVPPITREIFEITITKIEKEWHALQKQIPKQPLNTPAAKNKDDDDEDADSKCWICDDGECENSNAIVFCDGCDLAVHQDCYGVPFIPEGQWLCRKCQLLSPREKANCIFCPNTDGAFKQTVSAKWCHLLCALWIPEVTLQNPTFMEPVEGVERVPKQRWKLSCYICKQKMGACIQCSNKSCFAAFHVTCARRAKLFLKMKTHPPGTAIQPGESRVLLDSAQLKAFCDKHVPSDWRREHNTESAFHAAQEFYSKTMANKNWGDSQSMATTLQNSIPQTPYATSHDLSGTGPITPKVTLKITNKRKRATKNRIIWKLPSGAPVVPHILFNTVIAALSRFNVRSNKEYAAEVCKYWTLKREARRDASLLKRLQLANQAEAFTSNEVTRKNYAAMGPQGRAKLQRRLEFAIKLRHDLERLRLLCDDVKKREREKYKNAECLQEMVEVVYFPITPLVRPALERAQQLDSKDIFHNGLSKMWKRLQDQEYHTVAQFQKDLDNTLAPALAKHNKTDKPAQDTAMPDQPATPAATANTPAPSRLPLPPVVGQSYATATRIMKTLQPLLDDAREKERQLRQDPYQKDLYESEDRAIQKRRRTESLTDADAAAIPGAVGSSGDAAAADAAKEGGEDVRMEVDTVLIHADVTDDEGEKAVITPNHPRPTTPENIDDDPGIIGLPWYTRPFSPKGTSLLIEERWMGPEVMREMSPLSEIDEEQLETLANGDSNEDEMIDSPTVEESAPAAKSSDATAKHEDKTEDKSEEDVEEKSKAKSESKKSSSSRPSSSKSRPKSSSSSRSKSTKAATKPKKAVTFRPLSRGTRSAAKELAKRRKKNHKGYAWITVDDEGNEVDGEREINDALADGWVDYEGNEYVTPTRERFPDDLGMDYEGDDENNRAEKQGAQDNDEPNASITLAVDTPSHQLARKLAAAKKSEEPSAGNESIESRMSRMLDSDDDSDISSLPGELEEDPSILEQMDIDGQLEKEMRTNAKSSPKANGTGEEDADQDQNLDGTRNSSTTADSPEVNNDGDVELKDADEADDEAIGETPAAASADDGELSEGPRELANGIEVMSVAASDSGINGLGGHSPRRIAGDSSEDVTDEKSSPDEVTDTPSPTTDSTAFHTPAEEAITGHTTRSKASSSTRALSASTANLNIEDDAYDRETSEDGENAPPPGSSGRQSGSSSSRKSAAALSPVTPTKITLATPTPPTTRSRRKQEAPPSSNTRSGTKSTSSSSTTTKASGGRRR